MLAVNRRDRVARVVTAGRSPLTGLIFDGAGRPMTPVSARNRHGSVYRYYISAPLQLGTARASDERAMRLPAPAVEALVLDRLSRIGIARLDWAEARPRLVRVEVDQGSVMIVANIDDRPKVQHLPDGEHAAVRADGCVEIFAEMQLRSWAGRTEIVRGNRRAVGSTHIDAALVRGLARAHALVRERRSSHQTSDAFGAEHGAAPSYIRRLSRLAFLAPDIQQAIVEGRQPPGVTMERLMRIDLPMSWSGQRRELGF